MIRNREQGRSLDHFRRCADDAPAGTYEHVKELSALLGETCDTFMREVRALGLKANNCDLIHEVEATLYAYVKASNPDAPIFPTGEGFGASMGGPERERVLAQARANLAALKTLGVM
jgi:hypothetical protein